MAKRKPWDGVWELGKELGRGGQGVTFLARKTGEEDFTFALKKLHRQDDPERRVRMQIEATALEWLSDHEGIASLVDTNAHAYKSSDELFIVSEFVEGTHPNGPVVLEQAATIAIRLLEVLEHCHDMGYVHRDIKPENVILRSGRADDPVLLDFGLSFNKDREISFDTKSGQPIGPRSFIVLPEQAGKSMNKQDPRTDVIQVLGMFFFCLTGERPELLVDESGRPPHKHEAPKETLSKLAAQSGIDRVFKIGLRNEIDLRWQSATKLKKEISDLILPADARPREDYRAGMLEELEAYNVAPELIALKRLTELFRMTKSSVERSLKLFQQRPSEVTIRYDGMKLFELKGYFTGRLVLKDRVNPRIKVNLEFAGAKRDGELVFRTNVFRADHDRPLISKATIPFEDPAAAESLQALIDKGMRDAVRALRVLREEQTRAGAAGGREG